MEFTAAKVAKSEKDRGWYLGISEQAFQDPLSKQIGYNYIDVCSVF
jgi:hypothetical protein